MEPSRYRPVRTRSVTSNILAQQRRRNGTETWGRRSCQCEHLHLITHEKILLNGDVPRRNGNVTYSANRPLKKCIHWYLGIRGAHFGNRWSKLYLKIQFLPENKQSSNQWWNRITLSTAGGHRFSTNLTSASKFYAPERLYRASYVWRIRSPEVTWTALLSDAFCSMHVNRADILLCKKNSTAIILVKLLGAIICTRYFKIKTPNFVHTVGVIVSHYFQY